MIYYSLIAFLFLFSLAEQFRVRSKDLRPFFYLMVLSIVLIGGLRFEVGADWFSYNRLFSTTEDFSDIIDSREEKLFMLILYVSKSIYNNYSFFVFIVFFISFFVKLKLMNKYSSDVYLSLIVYLSAIFLIYDLNGIRQGMAMALTLFSIPFILRRRLWYFIVVVFIASTFHTSAIIFLPFYWIANLRISRNTILYIVLGAVLLSVPLRMLVLNNPLMSYLLTLERLSHYDSYVQDSETNTSVSIASIAVFQRVLVFIIVLINYNKLQSGTELKRLLLNGYAASIVLFLLFSFSAEFAARLSFYYKSIEILLIPLIVTSQLRLSNRIMLLVLFLMLSLLSVYRLLSIEGGGLLPYKVSVFN